MSTETEAGKFCVACGAKLVLTAIVCPSCGSPVSGSGSDTKLITASYLFAAFIPIIGFVFAVILGVKGKIGHAVACGLVSLIAIPFWSGFLQGMSGGY